MRYTAKESRFAKLDKAIEEDNNDFITNQEQLQEQIIQQQNGRLDELTNGVMQLKTMGQEIDIELDNQAKFLFSFLSLFFFLYCFFFFFFFFLFAFFFSFILSLCLYTYHLFIHLFIRSQSPEWFE